MKSHYFLLKLSLAIFFMSFFSVSFAQISVKEALDKMSTEPAPFSATKKTKFIYNNNFKIINQDNTIPDNMYDNIQLTQYFHAREDYSELGGETFRKFSIPGSSNKILIVSFGGDTDYHTSVLCIVSPSGIVLDTLEGEISFGGIYVKQYRIINPQSNITVTRIVPTSSTSISFNSDPLFTSFTGYRLDTIYSINSLGRFVKQSKKSYKTKTYTRGYLEDTSKDLWNGGEEPL